MSIPRVYHLQSIHADFRVSIDLTKTAGDHFQFRVWNIVRAKGEKQMKNLFVFAAVTLILIGATVRPTAAQLVNGSFESGLQDPGGMWITYHSPSNVIDGWSVSFGSIDYIGGWWQASEGVRSIDMTGASAGQISQTVPTIPGLTYVVTFDMSGNPGPPSVKLMTVTADAGQAQTFSYDTIATGNTQADMKWEVKQYTFTATGATTLLAFTSDVPGFSGPTLDNVRLEEVPQVPEDPGDPEIPEGVCHRNFGKKGQKTLMVSPSAIPAHLAHGDTIGPCEE